MKKIHLRYHRRDGAVLPLVTICLVGLMAFVALAIDVGMMAVARTQSQSAADIGALAGARTLNGLTGNNKTAAEAEALEAASSNYVLSSQILSSQVTTVQAGVYRYDTVGARFNADFATAPGANESWGAMKVRVSSSQPTYFGKVLGVNSMTVAAQATAVHRPRDIGIVLDFSGSMRFSSEFNYPSISGSTPVSGSLNPDSRFPRFGPWSIYPVATAGVPNPMHRLEQYVDSGGETHAVNNLTTETDNGPPIVNNFSVTAADATGSNCAFVYNGNLTAGAYNKTNTPVVTPTPDTWSSQYASGYDGDRWPLKWGVSTSSPTVANYATTAAQVTNIASVTSSSRNASFETSGYDWASLTFTNGPFQGYSMGPGYFGKTFYMWPPDPRFTTGADPTSISASNPVKDTSNRDIADWRKRFFRKVSAVSSTRGAPVDDNTLLYSGTGVWKGQNITATPNWIPDYDAILKWIKSGPQTLPTSCRAGRVVYWTSIPDSIPINWTTGLISTTATSDQRFWKEYIDFVIGAGRHNQTQTLYGLGSNNTWGASTFGTGKITTPTTLTGTTKPYMWYDDCPVHPRCHFWFGPLTMMGFFAVNSNVLDYTWYAANTYEAHCWQLKAGIQAALEDIKNNHPNDLAAMTFFSSHAAYSTPRVAMGKNYAKMKSTLFYPFSLIASDGSVSGERRPYTNSGSASTTDPCALTTTGASPTGYQGDIPNADGGTNPHMGLMVTYNQFNWSGSYTGRNGATKIVILETDGVANTISNGTFSQIGTTGRYNWTSISGGSAPGNGQPTALNPAITLAWMINQDATSSKPWPTFPAYTNPGGSIPNAGLPTKWVGPAANGPGFSTSRNPAIVHTLAFGYLFEDSTTSGMKTRALEFLRNVQIAGGLSADASTGTIEDYKRIVGTYSQRIERIRTAMERIMQSGVQVALIQ